MINLKKHQLNRREKLYGFIIGMMIGNVTWHDHKDYENGGFFLGMGSKPDKKRWYFTTEFNVNDLIVTTGSMCRNPHVFNIGICVEKHSEYEVIIKDIFTGDLCNYGNESYVAVKNIPFHCLLDDKQYKYWSYFRKACYKVDRYRLVPADAKFMENRVIFSTRERWGDKITIHSINYGLRMKDMVEILSDRMREKDIAK